MVFFGLFRKVGSFLLKNLAHSKLVLKHMAGVFEIRLFLLETSLPQWHKSETYESGNAKCERFLPKILLSRNGKISSYHRCGKQENIMFFLLFFHTAAGGAICQHADKNQLVRR